MIFSFDIYLLWFKFCHELSHTAKKTYSGLEPLCKDNFMVADGAVTKGVFGSVENTFEENDFVLELSLKVDGFEAPLSFSTVLN